MTDKEIDLIEKTRDSELIELTHNISSLEADRAAGMFSSIFLSIFYVVLIYLYISGARYDVGDSELYMLLVSFATKDVLIAISIILFVNNVAVMCINKAIKTKATELYLLVTRG